MVALVGTGTGRETGTGTGSGEETGTTGELAIRILSAVRGMVWRGLLDWVLRRFGMSNLDIEHVIGLSTT